MDINNLLEQFKQVQSIKEELKDMSWDDLASILEKAGVIDPEDYEGEPVGKYEILDCRYLYFDYTVYKKLCCCILCSLTRMCRGCN